MEAPCRQLLTSEKQDMHRSGQAQEVIETFSTATTAGPAGTMTVVPETSEERPDGATGAGDETRAGKRTRQLQRFSPENPLLTSEEVAELLGVSPKTVVQMAKRGSLPARHIPGTRRYLFFEREIFELLDASTVVPAAGKGDIDAEDEETDPPEGVAAPQRARGRAATTKKAQK